MAGRTAKLVDGFLRRLEKLIAAIGDRVSPPPEPVPVPVRVRR